MGLKASVDRFKYNHPKTEEFANSMRAKGFCENQEIAIAVRYPDGTELKTGIRVQASDLELLNTVASLLKAQQ